MLSGIVQVVIIGITGSFSGERGSPAVLLASSIYVACFEENLA
jgi:hypothetical protein